MGECAENGEAKSGAFHVDTVWEGYGDKPAPTMRSIQHFQGGVKREKADCLKNQGIRFVMIPYGGVRVGQRGRQKSA